MVNKFRGIFRVDVLFFLLTAVLMLVGDGKRSIVEVVAVAIVLILVVVANMKKRIHVPAGNVVFWWGLLLLYFFIRLPFSDSVAYSVYATARYLTGFAAFVLFANNLMGARAFGHGTVGLVLTALCLSMVQIIVPSMGTWAPEMSLLSNTYGHHHISYLLVFALPFVLHGFLTKKSTLHGLFILLYLVILVLTRARAAWFVTALYILFLLIRQISMGKKLRIGLVAVSVGLFVLFAFTSAAPKVFQYIKTGAPVREKTDFASARLGYWQQTIDAFKDRPIFGTGLGTFYLSSLRYQKQPQSYSWLAHSFPLQTLSEIGVIGVIGLVGLIWAAGRKTFRRYEDDRQPIIEAVVLTGLYGAVDITLDYMVIWILMWAGIGLLYGHKQQPASGRKAAWVLYGSLGLLILFYSISVGAEAGQLFAKNTVLLQPFNTRRTLAFLDARSGGPPLSQKQLDTILWFHRKNPVVLSAAADVFAGSPSDDIATGYYKLAIELYPKDTETKKKYLEFLVNTGRYVEAIDTLWSYYGVRSIDKRSMLSIEFVERAINKENNDGLVTAFGAQLKPLMFAKLYYLVGFSLLTESPREADQYWEIAQKLAPTWNYFYIERAALLLHVLHNETLSTQTLDTCEKIVALFSYCHKLNENKSLLTVPGALRDKVLMMK